MKTRRVVLAMLLLTIFGGILEYSFVERKETLNVGSNIITAAEKLDVRVKTAKKSKSKKKKASVKKSTKKKATKKKTTKKKTVKKVYKKKTTKKKTIKKVYKKKTTKKSTKRTSNAQIAELQAYAKDLVLNQFGWTEKDFQALVTLWYRESGWNVYAQGNGCYGIPQAKPGSKMSSQGKDWRTNGKTQIRWGLNYIAGRYGNPSKALKHSDKYHWY